MKYELMVLFDSNHFLYLYGKEGEPVKGWHKNVSSFIANQSNLAHVCRVIHYLCDMVEALYMGSSKPLLEEPET